jgi:zeta-carotene desaturase
MDEVDPSVKRESSDIVVAGTGVAGLTAAVQLADQGLAVTLLAAGADNRREAPGPDTLAEGGGDTLLGCCGHLLDLHQRLGLAEHIRWDRQLHWLDPAGQMDTLAGDDLPAPLHLLRSLLGLSVFNASQRVTLLRGMLALMQVSEAGRGQLAGQSLRQWLRDHRQAQPVIDRFWSPLCRVTCGAGAEHVAAGEAIHLLQAGLLQEEASYQLGVSGVGHEQLLAAARQRVEQAGGKMLADGGLTRIEVENQRLVRLHLADGQEVPADQAILSLAPPRLIEAASGLSQLDGRFAKLPALEPTPRLDVHLSVTRPGSAPTLPTPHLLAMESALALILRREGANQADPHVEYLQALIPEAGDWIDRPAEQIASDVEAELRRLLPSRPWGPIQQRQVIKRPEAAYTHPPGVTGARPAATGAIENLYFAGSWCDTGWPATLEGAAAAGTQAAQHLLTRLGREAPAIREIRPTPSLLYRLLSA